MSSYNIPKSCVGLEATLSDGKKKYIDKVNALLAAWEHVTNYIANTPEKTQTLIEWANEHTLELVLRGEWPKLAPATKTHLNVTLQRCATLLNQKQQEHEREEDQLEEQQQQDQQRDIQQQQRLTAYRRCQALIELVQNPWSKPALDKILNGQSNPENEEEDLFCQEKGQLLKMRLKILCEDRCEDIAVNLAAACVRSLRRNDRLRSLSEPSQVQYMMDVYIVLLYKLKRTHDIVAQLKLMDLKEGLEMMQRLSGEKPTKYGTARVWRNSNKAAELVAQYLVTTGMVRPVSEVGSATLEQILNSWALLHAKAKDVVSTLPGIIRKLTEPAESAQHIYIFCGVLIRHFGDAIKPFVIELYIRALTTDMNELENQKSKANKEKEQETAQRLSLEFLRLADYVSNNIGVARELVLTAFSLHPTRACCDRIKELAVASGKISREANQLDKVELLTTDRLVKKETKLEDFECPHEMQAANFEVTKGIGLSFKTTIKEEPGLSKEVSTDVYTDDRNSNTAQLDTVSLKNQVVKIEVKPDPDEVTVAMKPGHELTQDALILIKGDAVTGSANYDEKAIPSHVLDGEKLGISPQLCDDLAVVLSSQRYHVLTWWLEWKELSELCERYLENAEEMRNTNKELKYLNIDYSQFKDHPYEDDPRDNLFYGIEKGYEQWDDSDYSESDAFKQSATAKTTTRRNLNESSDTDSETVIVQTVKKGRSKKVTRLESSGSEYDIRHRKPRQRFRRVLMSSSESDTNTQDSQTDSLGSDGFRKNSKRIPKKTCNGAKKVTKLRPKKTKLTVDSVSHFRMLVNENIRPPGGIDGVGDNSNNDIMTLFSADMDENKRETIKGSAAFKAAHNNLAQLIISEKRSDPEVIKSLRMFRPHSKKLIQINPKTSNSLSTVGIKKENNTSVNENNPKNVSPKFAPMLSTLNLNPKIALRRVDEIDKKISGQQQKQQAVSVAALNNELRNIPFSSNKNSMTGFTKQKRLNGSRKEKAPKSIKSNLGKSNLEDILTNSVPGMRSMEFSVMPRQQSTVHVVQLTRNISQSPNSTASGNTPPRSRSNIQLPGTPSSGGHDSGVGMSPAGQTPPPPTRSSSLQDVGEEANQPPDHSPSLDSISTLTMDSTEGMRTVALAVLSNQRMGLNQSPSKSPSPSINNATEQQLVLCKPDGTYQLVSPSIASGQQNILSLQNFEDGNISFARQIPVASVASTEMKTRQSQTSRNTGLPKFQQAFGKTICTLSTESTTAPSSSATDAQETPATPTGASTNVQCTTVKSTTATTNTSKSVQTSVQNTSITNISNMQVSAGTRQILNLVQSAVTSTSSNAVTTGGQTLQLCSVPNSTTPGVIYTHKIPVTIAGSNPTTQLISIPAAISNNRSPVQVKLNFIRTAPFRSSTGAIQAVLASRIQQQQSSPTQQQSQSQSPTIRQADSLINSSMEIPTNQVSSSTLEQLREFESVLEQVKERSTSQSSSTDTTTVQTQTHSTAKIKQPQNQQSSVGSLNQQLLISSQSPSNSIEFPSNGNTVTFQQQEVYPQKVALMYTNQNSGSATSKVVTSTPVVVVTSYCQPAASPALSVTSQSSSSPCVTPAPTPVSSTGNTQVQVASKSAKKAATKTVKVSTQSTLKTTPIPKPQQKPQEDPETTQRIYAILGQYAEQLRNSPDLNNKPAPRRRSNPPTNPNQSSKRKKSSTGKSKVPSGQQTSEPSPSAEDTGRTMGSEDSSGGGGGTGSGSGSVANLLHIQGSPTGFSVSEDTVNPNSNPNSQSASNDNATLTMGSETKIVGTASDSNDAVEMNVRKRSLVFTEPSTGPTRTVIVQEALQSTNVSEALASVTGKMTTGTAVLVSGTNFMLPMNFVKSGQQITVVSGGSKLLAAVPAVRTGSGASGAVSNAFVLQSLLSQANKVIQQQQHQQKQVKQQQSQIVVPQSSGIGRLASEPEETDKPNFNVEANKSPATTIGLFQHSGVITSNPNLSQRIFNSSCVKLPPKAESVQSQQVVCLTAPTMVKEPEVQKVPTTVGLAFASSTDDDATTVIHALKKTKQADTLVEIEDEKILSPKAVKRKEEQIAVGIADTFTQCNARAEITQSTNQKMEKSLSPAPVMTPTTISSHFLVSGGPSSSDSQGSVSSTIRNSALVNSSMIEPKIENGILCGNTRLQEAWEPERKESPDTPWRYIPTTNTLSMEPMKIFSRDTENSEAVHNSILQIINKGQGIEMSNSIIYQNKKYYQSINSSTDSFQKFPSKSVTKSSPTNNARSTADQENQQRINERKQQMLERELRLQKSLSEECEDLGVDEPSTSDLFPEADLLFDTNHSPSFDHSSQEASCSQTLSGTTAVSSIKSYSGTGSNTSIFKSVDSALSISKDMSPIVRASNPLSETKKKALLQRRTSKHKETHCKRSKRALDDLPIADRDCTTTAPKQLKLSLIDSFSQHEASNSNFDLSRASLATENNLSKKILNQKITNRNGSMDRGGTPSSSRSNIHLQPKLGKDMDSSSVSINVASMTLDPIHRIMSINNMSSTASSGEEDENLTLLGDSAANVTIPSPLSPIAGPLLMTHRFTYTNNKKRTTIKQPRKSDYFSVATKVSNLSWENSNLERTRSSVDNDEENDCDEENEEDESSNAIHSFVPISDDNTEVSNIGNGLQEINKSASSTKVTPTDHATYTIKRKIPAIRRTTTNHQVLNKPSEIKTSNVSDSKKSSTTSTSSSSSVTVTSAAMTTLTGVTTSENESSSPVLLRDKIYEINHSDDETSTTIIMNTSTVDSSIEHCSTAAARRSSLRGQVKKGCACCNGSQDRPKSKKPIIAKPQQLDLSNSKLKRQKQQLQSKPFAKKR